MEASRPVEERNSTMGYEDAVGGIKVSRENRKDDEVVVNGSLQFLEGKAQINKLGRFLSCTLSSLEEYLELTAMKLPLDNHKQLQS